MSFLQQPSHIVNKSSMVPPKTDQVVKLPLQRRLRHLFSLEIRNFSLINAHLSSHVLLHFTLQPSSSSQPFYASERLPVSVDLIWGGFNIKAILSAKKQSIAFEQQVLASRQLCVKVWKYDQISQTTALLVEYNIDMFDLIPFNAAAYVTHGLKYAPNTLVVNLIHGSFAFVLPSAPGLTTSKQSKGRMSNKESPTSEVVPLEEQPSVPFSNMLYTREPKKSYTLSAVARMCTVAKALRQSADLAFSRQNEIENKLSERIQAVAAEQARERLRSEVEVMIRRRQKLEAACQVKRMKLQVLQSKTSTFLEESAKTSADSDDLVSWTDNMANNFSSLLENISSKRKLVHWRRGQMIADLYDIYSIKRHDGLCFISNVPLPDAVLLPKSSASPSGAISVTAPSSLNSAGGVISVPFSTMSIAIGYAAHYLLFIHWLFGIQPRYKIVFRGSHSAIFDHIHTQLASDVDRTFPLYFPDRSSYQRFRYGIFLLARVASQLRFCLTQKRQNSSGAQLLENISWTLHDMFVSSSRPSLPITSIISRQHHGLIDASTEPRASLGSVEQEQTPARSAQSSSPGISIWTNSDNGSGAVALSNPLSVPPLTPLEVSTDVIDQEINSFRTKPEVLEDCCEATREYIPSSN